MRERLGTSLQMQTAVSLDNIQGLPYMGEDRGRACEEQFRECIPVLNHSRSQKLLKYQRPSVTPTIHTLDELETERHCSKEISSKPFCWNCCCLQIKRKQGGDNQENKSNGNNNIVTAEDVLSWKESFDKLISSANGRRALHEFLRSEYSEENLSFWLACEDLRICDTSDDELVQDKARTIYEDFISILSPKEVSLDARVREIINENMINPSTKTFDEAQTQIYTLMHRDSYPRFLGSPVFKKYLESVGKG